MASTSSTASASEEADAARLELGACEKEIATVKALLRSLGPAAAAAASAAASAAGGDDAGGDDAGADSTTAAASDDSNRLTVTWIKTEGLPEAAQPKLTLQLSSPVEEAELTKPLDPADEESKWSGRHSFRGVETGQAMLSVTAADLDIPLGSSTTYDLAPLLKFDALEEVMGVVEKEMRVEIHSEAKAISSTASEETEEDDAKTEESFESAVEEDPKEAEEAKAREPVCTVTLRLTYAPSDKDRREELYEILNKITRRKAAAVEKLRKAAVTASRMMQQQQQQGNSRMVSRSAAASPAVRAGFLNKQQKEESKVVRLYNKHLGPQSMLRRLFPVARNYLFFTGAVLWMHFKGQLLALPPPV